MRVGQLLSQFKDLSKQLIRALKQNNYSKAQNIALKQQLLVEKITNVSSAELSFKRTKQWELALKNYQDLRISLESDLKHLNSSTKQTLKLLSGYAEK
tara:strand:- start:450 stop:743 length:294 start_codon:yes stop_codon:yes gene_type:complete